VTDFYETSLECHIIIIIIIIIIKNTKIRVYRTVVLPVVSYGCETSSLTLREE
jgi:hypothetical protein